MLKICRTFAVGKDLRTLSSMAKQEIILPPFPSTENSGEIVLYQPNDEIKLDVRLENETVWLSQQQMAMLFGVNRQAITKHIKNIYETGELHSQSTCSILELVQKEGNRMVTREVGFYNLDVIISVGFRVNTLRGIQFRQWANCVLKEYMLRGYAVNQRLLHIEERIDNRLAQHERILAEHQEKIDFFVRTNLPPVEQVFFDGEFWEARVLLERLIKTATKRVVIIDHYIDSSNFDMLDVRNAGVKATIYSYKDFADLRDLHNAQPNVEPIETFVWSKPSHDRWLIVDDVVYHCGHSLKDMGKKMCAISRMGCDADTILNQVR